MGQIANGYDLRLADRGEGLSGGQRQSIAIARALAGKPPIMLMDEPSSAMDAQTEGALIQRLREELKGRTLVLITHRPPLLQLVDRIILIDKGKIVSDGPRDNVLKQIMRPQGGAETPMHGTHLEDLTDRIKPRTASNLLLWFVVAFIVAFFLWAGFTKLDRTVRGQGRVIPSAHLQVISNLEGGVVQEILVHAGQEVQRRRRADPPRPDRERLRARQRRRRR